MKKYVLAALALILSINIQAQSDKITPEQYIERYKDIAVAEMYRTGIPASIKLAQGFLESGFGNSELAVRANNLFGIKGVFSWDGDYYEYKGSNYRKYNNADQSFIDHSEYLKLSPKYRQLFKYEKTDYQNWALGLQAANYGSSETYAEHLLDIIKRYNLNQYDTYPNPTNEKEEMIILNNDSNQ